jgi:DNA modification methylase
MAPSFEENGTQVFQGDVLAILRQLPDESVQCCVTSPPYWALRDYKVPPSIWGGDADCDHEWNSEDYQNTRLNDETAGPKQWELHT